MFTNTLAWNTSLGRRGHAPRRSRCRAPSAPAIIEMFNAGVRLLGLNDPAIFLFDAGFQFLGRFCLRHDYDAHPLDAAAVLVPAIRMHTKHVVLVHQHPWDHGAVSVLPLDVSVTSEIASAARRQDLELYEHVIVTSDPHGPYYSCRAQGLTTPPFEDDGDWDIMV